MKNSFGMGIVVGIGFGVIVKLIYLIVTWVAP